MRALFGVVSLLVVLAIVALVAMKQMKAVGRAGTPVAGSSGDLSSAPLLPANGGALGTSRDLQKRVTDDVAKAMQQGADARKEASDKP